MWISLFVIILLMLYNISILIMAYLQGGKAMGKFVIFSKRGRRFVKLVKGRLFCGRMGVLVRKQLPYQGKLPDGVYQAEPQAFGFDDCERIT
jgi:hypothetical protein